MNAKIIQVLGSRLGIWALLWLSVRLPAAELILLSGDWQVQLQKDPQQQAADPAGVWQPIRLPGSLTSNNIGDDIGPKTPWMGSTGHGGFFTEPRYAPYREPGKDFKVPFWLQPDKYYLGTAWYRREIAIPKSWQGKHIELSLERCHWNSMVYVDGKAVGFQDSLGTPHRYDLSALSTGEHTLTIGVDNRYLAPVGRDASSITDHTQTNWNGIVGDISLKATDPVWIADLQAYPDIHAKRVRVVAKLGNSTEKPFRGTLKLTAESFNADIVHRPPSVEISIDANVVEAVLPVGDEMQLWDEFRPALYRLQAVLSGDGIGDLRTTTFGMREIKAVDRTIQVNDVPRFMRGTLDCASFPKTGYPAMDLAEWRRIFKNCKAYGLNHMRFHSWCPPEAAFAAADLEGVYLQVECGVWSGTGDEPFLLAETPRIVGEYGNHPSFALLSHGNEPGNHAWLRDTWVPFAKKLDSRHLVTAGSHHPLTANSDYLVPGCVEGFWYRYQGAFNTPPATTRNYEAQVNKRPQPAIAHETGQWCVFPNLKEIDKYTGCMKARNFEIVRDFMKNNHLLGRAEDFLMASGRFQTLVYKEDNEAYLRTRGCAGYQMLGLNDFPGQGTALVGVVDVFYEDKGYVHPDEFSEFNGPVVPLALMDKRVWTNDETFSAQIRIAQYSGTTLKNARPAWEIIGADGRKLAGGELAAGDIPVGNATDLGTVTMPLASVAKATKLTLKVTLPGTEWRNEWSFWVYPKAVADPAIGGAAVCRTPAESLEKLAQGQAVILLLPPKMVAGKTAGTFQPIFWNKPWFPGQREHTLGWLIQKKHPALNGFPTDFHTDWQWWDLMQHCKPMVLDQLPSELCPIAEPIDDWNTCRRLGTLFEAKVGKGRLLVCSMDLESDLARRPVARQLRRSLQDYADSPDFNPKVEITGEQLQTLVSGKPNPLVVKATADSENGDYAAGNAIDGDPETVWHTEWKDSIPGYPHQITLELAREASIAGVRLLPRQDGNANGWVKNVEIQISANGKEWTTAATASLSNNQEWKSVDLAIPVKGKFVRIHCLSPQNPAHAWASFAEIAPILR